MRKMIIRRILILREGRLNEVTVFPSYFYTYPASLRCSNTPISFGSLLLVSIIKFYLLYLQPLLPQATSRDDSSDESIFCCLTLSTFIIVLLSFIVALLVLVVCSIHHRPYYVNLDGVHGNFTTPAAMTNDTLNYHLDLSISLRNPNKYYSVHHHELNVMAAYNNTADDALIGTVKKLNYISQKPKSNVVLTRSFKGVISHEVDTLVVSLNLKNKYKTHFLGWKAMPEFECDLKVPSVNGNGQSFELTTEEACKVEDEGHFSFPIPLAVYFFFLVFLAPSLFPVSKLLAYIAFVLALTWYSVSVS